MEQQLNNLKVGDVLELYKEHPELGGEFEKVDKLFAIVDIKVSKKTFVPRYYITIVDKDNKKSKKGRLLFFAFAKAQTAILTKEMKGVLDYDASNKAKQHKYRIKLV